MKALRAIILLFAMSVLPHLAAAQPSSPAATAATAEKDTATEPANATKSLPVRAEGFTQDDFARIIFRTGKAGKFQTNLKGDVLSVAFDVPVKVDYAGLLTTLKDHITGAKESADGKTVLLTLKNSDVKVRRFIGEDFVGVDLVNTGLAPAAKATAAADPKDPPVQTAKAAPVSIVPEAARPKKEQPAAKAKPFSILPEVSSPAKPQDQAAAINTKPNTLIPTFKPEATPAFPWLDPAQHKPKPRVVAQSSPKAADGSTDAGPTATGEATPGETAPKPEEVDRTVLLVNRQNVEKGITLNLPWKQETAAAVFARGQYIWAVFNAPIRLDLANIKGIKYIESINQIQNKQYAILKIKLPSAYRVDKEGAGETALTLSTDKQGYQWSISVQEDAALTGSAMSNPVIAESGVREGRTSVFLPVTQAAEPLTLTDEEVGDQLVIIPLPKAQNGIAPSYRYVDFSLPQTAQGIVIRKVSDTVSYRLLPNGVEISSADQLNISPDLFRAADNTQQQKQVSAVKKIVLPTQSVFPFKPFDKEAAVAKAAVAAAKKEAEEAAAAEAAKEDEGEHGKNKEHGEEEEQQEEAAETEAAPVAEVEEFTGPTFMEQRDKLYEELEDAADDKKSDKRLEIAKFFFQEGLYSESLGVLHEIKVLDPIYANMYDVDLTVAADNYLLDRYTEALEQFQKLAKDAQGLASHDELRLWEWASRYKLTKGEHQENTEDMPVDYIASYDKFMQQYPEELRYAFGLLAIEAKLERKEVENADLILQVISGAIPPKFANSTKFMQGMIASLKGNVEDAEGIWEGLSGEVDDRFNRARATFELTKLRLIHGQITVDQAVEVFSQLAVVWRGDNFELDLLKLVGQLYIREKNYLEGLRAWNVLVLNFPSTKEAIYIAGKMKKIFVELFDEGEAYHLPPKDALALYFEFRDLTPVGERGDRIIQQLADHFIKADLLDNAAALLQHQIEYRARGKQKNELVLKLGELQLSNKKPAKTLDALQFMDQSAADDTVQRTAKYLKARAQLVMGQYAEVLDTLQDDFSDAAQNIRLEVFWHDANWFGIINTIEKRLDAMRDTGPFPLKGQEIEDIVKLSVAYGMQEEREKLRMLKRDFAERIDSEKLQNIFGFVTNDIPSVDYHRFDETVQLKEIENFMNDYAFWPGKDWQNVANVLNSQVEGMKRDAPPLSREEEQAVVRLALAYAMLTRSADPAQAKEAEKELSRLSRDFRNVTVNRNTLNVFGVLDDKFIKKTDDAVFEGTVSLKDIPNFAEQYQAARSISELNVVVKQ